MDQDVRAQRLIRADPAAASDLLRAHVDAVLDPLVLCQAVRNASGRIVDFTYLDVNEATTAYLSRTREQLVGSSMLASLPGLDDVGLLAAYAHAVDADEPVSFDGFRYPNEILGVEAFYDIRGRRAPGDRLSLTWRDVTERQRAADRLAESEARVRAAMDSMLDPYVILQAVRDDDGAIIDFEFADANSAAAEFNGMSREDLIGVRLLGQHPAAGTTTLFDDYVRVVETDEAIIRDNWSYPQDLLGGQIRRYDVRAVKFGDGLSQTWRDVTERFEDEQRIAESEKRLQTLIDSMVEPWVLLAAVRDESRTVVDFEFADANPAALGVYQMTKEQLVGQRLSTLHPAARTTDLFDMYVRVVEDNEPMILDDWAYPQDIYEGEVLRYDVRAWRVGDAVSQTWRDISERYDANQRVAAAEEQYRLLADNSADVVMRLRGGTIVWISPSVTQMLGGAPNEWVGLSVADFLHPDDTPVYAQSLGVIDEGETVVRRVRIRAHDGTYHWIEAHAKAFFDADGHADGHVSALRIVDTEVAVERELVRLARFDALTGVMNRAEAIARLKAASVHPRTPGAQNGALFCDVDRFKEINDSYGHAAGDTVLRVLARRITECVRSEDVVARMGGDEFLVFLSGMHDIGEAVTIAEKMRAAAAAPIALGANRGAVHASLSIGVALAVPGESTDSFIERADTAMYVAKRSGRNRVTLIH